MSALAGELHAADEMLAGISDIDNPALEQALAKRQAVITKIAGAAELDLEDYHQLRASLQQGGAVWRSLILHRQSLQQQWLDLHKTNHRLRVHRSDDAHGPSHVNCSG